MRSGLSRGPSTYILTTVWVPIGMGDHCQTSKRSFSEGLRMLSDRRLRWYCQDRDDGYQTPFLILRRCGHMSYGVCGMSLLWRERRDTRKLGDDVLFTSWFEYGHHVDGGGETDLWGSLSPRRKEPPLPGSSLTFGDTVTETAPSWERWESDCFLIPGIHGIGLEVV